MKEYFIGIGFGPDHSLGLSVFFRRGHVVYTPLRQAMNPSYVSFEGATVGLDRCLSRWLEMVGKQRNDRGKWSTFECSCYH